jgi:hypothetical protein
MALSVENLLWLLLLLLMFLLLLASLIVVLISAALLVLGTKTFMAAHQPEVTATTAASRGTHQWFSLGSSV